MLQNVSYVSSLKGYTKIPKQCEKSILCVLFTGDSATVSIVTDKGNNLSCKLQLICDFLWFT